MSHDIDVPSQILGKWQEIVNLVADIMGIPSALIMRKAPPDMAVLVASESDGNPYEANETAPLNTGRYCEAVMNEQRLLLIPDARQEDAWKSNPDLKRGMISYMGFPIAWPDGEIFGTICVLDSRKNAYGDAFLKLLLLCRNIVQADLQFMMTLSRQLHDRETRIQGLVDADIIGIFIWEMETKTIVEANDAFLHIVGYDRADVAARRLQWTSLTPPEWLEHDLRYHFPELRRTGRLPPFEKEYLRKDGSRVPVLMGVARFGDDGNLAVAFMLDQTQRKLAEAEARESDRRFREIQGALAHANRVATMGQLTASICHQLKQPVGACAIESDAGLRWLGHPTPNLDEANRAFRQIGKNARVASEIMSHIAGLFKKAPVEKKAVQINDVIRDIVVLTQGEAVKHAVVVELDLPDGLPVVHGDSVQLQQAVLNLVVNAIEAMSTMKGRPHTLTIRTAVDAADRVLVSVTDSGPGIAEDIVGRLFEPFHTSKASGMGMGLTVCRSVIEAHGGALRLCQSGPQGAMFEFTLRAS